MFEKDYFKEYKENVFRNKFWVSYIKENIQKGIKILVMGCAYGYLPKRLEENYEVYGIDISNYAIDQAKKISKKSKFKVMDAENIRLKQKFDVIFCLDILEHLENPEKCIKSCNKLLNQGGLLIISIPNLNSLLKPLKGVNWFGYRDKTHVSLLKPKRWKRLLKRNNFRIVKEFTDGFFDIPYFSFLKFLQKLFLIPGWLQYKIKKPFIHKIGENLILIAKRL